MYAKCNLMDRLLNYNLILGRDILHELGIIFNIENITMQEVSISMKQPNCTSKEFFVNQESHPFRNATKRIKQFLDTEYKKLNFKPILMNLLYLKYKILYWNYFRNMKKCLMEPKMNAINGAEKFISDFRELNKTIKKTFPTPNYYLNQKVLDMTHPQTSLWDIITLHKVVQLSWKLCTVVLRWGKFEYHKLPMGLFNSPDIFQEKMNELFNGLEYDKIYSNDLLIISQ